MNNNSSSVPADPQCDVYSEANSKANDSLVNIGDDYVDSHDEVVITNVISR